MGGEFVWLVFRRATGNLAAAFLPMNNPNTLLFQTRWACSGETGLREVGCTSVQDAPRRLIRALERTLLEFIITGQPHIGTFLVGGNRIDEHHGHGEASDSSRGGSGSHEMKIRLVTNQQQANASKVRYVTFRNVSYSVWPMSTSMWKIPDRSIKRSGCKS